VKITYIESDGTAHVVDATCGWSLMENAVKNGVPGILAECGGSATCGTCRIYIDAEWSQKIDAPHSDELELLKYVEEEDLSARLSCQIKMNEGLDGIVVKMPDKQYRTI
jgi:2Fe-2S ferredoxin